MISERYRLLKNIRLVDPSSGRTEGTDLLYLQKEGKSTVLQMGKGLKPQMKEGLSVANMHGALACPAFTDLRCAHPDPDFEYRESLQSCLLSAQAGGFSRILTRPVKNGADTPQKYEAVTRSAAKTADCRLFPAVPLTLSGKGQTLSSFEALKEKGALAITADLEKTEISGRLLLDALKESGRLGMLFIAPAKDKSLAGRGVNKGRIAQRLKEEGEEEAAELLALARALMLAHTANLPVHFPLVTLKESVELVRKAKKAGVPITAATAPPYFSLTESELLFIGENARLSPPLRREEDREAVIEGLADGTVDCICSDHTPLSDSEKTGGKNALPGAVGLETVFAAGLTHLVLPGHLPLFRLLELLSISPARLLGIDASVKEGAPLDLAFLECEGELVYNRHSMRSRSHNTPFYGRALLGRVTDLYIDGIRQN
jgi:dihydroorotase